MKKGFLSLSRGALLFVLATAASPAVTIYEDPGVTNSILFRDFTSAPGSVSFNNAQLQSADGNGTTVYESNGNASDPQVVFGGGSLDLVTYPNFRTRYAITGGAGGVVAWRNPAIGGQEMFLPDGGGSFVEGSSTVPVPLPSAGGFRVDPLGSGVGWTFEIDYIRIDTTPTIGFEFDHAGDNMGLSLNTAYQVANFNNGSFVGQSNAGGGAASDVTITIPAVDPNIYQWMELRMRADAGDRIDLFFSNTDDSSGNPFTVIALTGDGSTDGNFHTYLVDLSDEADWSGALDFLRLDPATFSESNFEIDYIRFMADPAFIPEPSALLLLALGAIPVLRRRR